MKKILIAATAACGLAAATVPAVAQMEQGTMVEMTTAQKAMYDGWPAENRATYDAWPTAAKEYYWTLNDNQKNVWWNTLNNEQRVRIVEMAPQQRAAAWQSINSQLSGTATATATTTRTTTAANTRINYNGTPTVQNIDTSPAPAELPICSPEQQDNCINRGAR